MIKRNQKNLQQTCPVTFRVIARRISQIQYEELEILWKKTVDSIKPQKPYVARILQMAFSEVK